MSELRSDDEIRADLHRREVRSASAIISMKFRNAKLCRAIAFGASNATERVFADVPGLLAEVTRLRTENRVIREAWDVTDAHFATAEAEVSQLRAKAKEGLRKVSSASVKAVMDANESVDYINGLEAAYAIFRAVLAEPLGSTEDPPATDERRSE
jgi:hypothetical protein